MSDQSVKELFSDGEYCKQELIRIREAWGNKDTFNAKTLDAIRQTLGFMFLYAPENLQSMVDATMYELDMREQFLLGIR